MLEWLTMGGSWAYIWPAYGLALAGLASLLAAALAAHSRAQRALRESERTSKA